MKLLHLRFGPTPTPATIESVVHASTNKSQTHAYSIQQISIIMRRWHGQQAQQRRYGLGAKLFLAATCLVGLSQAFAGHILVTGAFLRACCCLLLPARGGSVGIGAGRAAERDRRPFPQYPHVAAHISRPPTQPHPSTGGAGYIGSHTCCELLRAGKKVVVVDNLANSVKESLDRVQEIAGASPGDLEFRCVLFCFVLVCFVLGDGM